MENQIANQIKLEMPSWQISQNQSDKAGSCLYKKFVFTDFSSAIQFMQSVASFCNQIDHHPKWTNVYNKIEVFLSSWDENSSITQIDIELAKEMDRQFAKLSSKNVNKQDKSAL